VHPSCQTLGFLLLTVSSLGVGTLFFVEALQSLQVGVFTFTSRRGFMSFTATQAESPIAFSAGIVALVVFGMLLCSVAVWQMSALLRPARPQSHHIIETAVSSIEREAPSGLKPLWVGLLLVAICLVLYAAA
jgi:uncharacterized membrane protein YhhN